MSINLLNSVQNNLGYPALKKINPNTSVPKTDHSRPDPDRLAQAVVPSVLAGIYELSKSENGVQTIIFETRTTGWVKKIFGDKSDEVLKNISEYSFYNTDAVEDKMNEAAVESIKLIRENTDGGEDASKVKNLISQQRNNFLPYLLPSLHIGNLVDDTTLDDTTTKMEGPISSLMHAIEKGFSGPETQEDADKKHF